MKLRWLLGLGWLINHVSGQFPGPRQVEVENGREVWKAKVSADGDNVHTYAVNDLSGLGIRPKIVYNCDVARALCKTASGYLSGGTTYTFHYDADWRPRIGAVGNRAGARRGASCPNNWKSTHDCPESDQPKFTTQDLEGTFLDANVWKGLHNTDDPDETYRLSRMNMGVDENGLPEEQWKRIHVLLSCDEWPAASWIEGGTGANTYCAPLFNSCIGKRGKGTKERWGSDQDWQAMAHNQVRNFYDKFRLFPNFLPYDLQDEHDINWTIFKVDFEMVNNGVNDYAVWLEAGGKRRYCYGPQKNIAGITCKTVWETDPTLPEEEET